LPVPEALKLVPVPNVVLTVTVSESAPVTVGFIDTETVQLLPEAIVPPAVQVPKVSEKSVDSELGNGLEVKVTGPPEALKVTVPQETEVPTVEAPQVKLFAVNVPNSGVPVTVAVGAPLLVVTVTVSFIATVVLPKYVGVMMQVAPELAVVQPVAPLLARVKFVALLPAIVVTVEAQYVPDAVSVSAVQASLVPWKPEQLDVLVREKLQAGAVPMPDTACVTVPTLE
jgi:hypothetical protein